MSVRCNKCGGEFFELTLNVHDQVTYKATINEDGSYEMLSHLKEFCGDSELDETQAVECLRCGKSYEWEDLVPSLHKGEKPWTVILVYPVGSWPTNSPSVYLNHTLAKDEREAIHNVQKMAEKDNHDTYDHEDFEFVAIFQGHIDAWMVAQDM